ncbi:hypothetical protein LY78DRAFT_52660 [Colletotrichum sublineola]|nr:hypothetical protein LY78DRAFT_52660 [Colletotrichum sublineola]
MSGIERECSLEWRMHDPNGHKQNSMTETTGIRRSSQQRASQQVFVLSITCPDDTSRVTRTLTGKESALRYLRLELRLGLMGGIGKWAMGYGIQNLKAECGIDLRHGGRGLGWGHGQPTSGHPNLDSKPHLSQEIGCVALVNVEHSGVFDDSLR